MSEQSRWVGRWVGGLALAVPLAVLGGCDDTLYGVPIGGEGGVVEPEYDVSFAGVEAMWVDHCQVCHPAVNEFDLGQVVADIEQETGMYVVPGDPEASMLWRLISGTRLDDDPRTMPDGSPTGLRPVEREHVRLWILDGAPVADETSDEES